MCIKFLVHQDAFGHDTGMYVDDVVYSYRLRVANTVTYGLAYTDANGNANTNAAAHADAKASSHSASTTIRLVDR